ncbi:MAG: DUF4214 domain-containing protein [Acidimicrobiales bacterium]|nr:DUF4214 domain-containing protein [Acidimicrobiales bacterium]HRW37728.1 DUF4214 domain-containing protein [Aquihabitans sp.]
MRRRSSRSTTRRTLVVATLVVATALGALAPARPADAAGVTTHAWMDLDAIERVTTPELKALLEANRDLVRSGAHFPDSGYALSNTYGEEAHWQRFHDAYLDQILARGDCGDPTAPRGPCAPEIAFLMGMIGHGMGDEVWDWLFEPNGPDLDEYYSPDSLAGYANDGGAELQMDLVAIADHHQPTTGILPFPNHDRLLATFAAVGRGDVDDSQLNLGEVAMGVVKSVEASWAPEHIDAIHEAMPWMSHNLVDGPGGVHFAATAIAGEWEAMWGRVLGAQPQTSVSITYPADGQRRLPTTGWNRNMEAGSSRGRGGARTRIAAALTYARPYTGSAGTVSTALPAGSMTLVERDSGDPVPFRSGWPRSVPYGPDAGEHLIGLQPGVDLAPCTWYRAGVTSNLVDARDEPVAPHTWEFRTGADADGSRCPDDPYTADENFARKATSDLLGRPATDDELAALGYAAARGTTRATWTTDLLGSQEERELLVTEAFQHDLGRAPDPSGLAYWANQLRTISLPELHAKLLGSPEVYRRAGGTNAAYVAALYPLVHGRTVDPSGARYWTGRLDAGLRRSTLGLSLLTSHESAQRTVVQAFQRFLGRGPDPSGRTYWTGYLQRGKDPRDLWRSLILSAEYDRRAQEA